MNIGWVGLGKLGMPCATALASYGSHDVVGYDVLPPNLETPGLKIADSISDVVKHTDDIVYVAVQTPHSPEFGGERRLPVDENGALITADFEYNYLINAVRNVVRAAEEQGKPITIVVVSTVLPGTMDRFIRPILGSHCVLVYHPFFIAMGTVVDDFIRPEFLLIGADHDADAHSLLDVYKSIHNSPACVISIASAELTKVAYNTFITSKIVFANTLAEMCEHTGADVDQVTDALSYGTERIISTKYMRAGMGDGGACHPRDNVALSSLAQRFDMSVDYMGYLAGAREAHTTWLASIILHWTMLTGFPVVLLGKAYKADINMTAGSPALLLAEILETNSVSFTQYDHVVHQHHTVRMNEILNDEKTRRVYFIATDHSDYRHIEFPAGSVVIDPFGMIRQQRGVTLVTPGRKAFAS